MFVLNVILFWTFDYTKSILRLIRKCSKVLRHKSSSFPVFFSTDPLKFGQLMPYPERAKKNKHFSENFMKIG